MAVLDDVLPHYRWAPRYSRSVAADPERAFAAARALTGRELPVTRALVLARGLGRGRGSAADPDRPVLDAMVSRGFRLVGREPTSEVIVGIGQPWRLRGGDRVDPDTVSVAGFGVPGTS